MTKFRYRLTDHAVKHYGQKQVSLNGVILSSKDSDHNGGWFSVDRPLPQLSTYVQSMSNPKGFVEFEKFDQAKNKAVIQPSLFVERKIKPLSNNDLKELSYSNPEKLLDYATQLGIFIPNNINVAIIASQITWFHKDNGISKEQPLAASIFIHLITKKRAEKYATKRAKEKASETETKTEKAPAKKSGKSSSVKGKGKGKTLVSDQEDDLDLDNSSL